MKKYKCEKCNAEYDDSGAVALHDCKKHCPKCGKYIGEQPPSRDYTNKCSDCFAKGFVDSIFKK